MCLACCSFSVRERDGESGSGREQRRETGNGNIGNQSIFDKDSRNKVASRMNNKDKSSKQRSYSWAREGASIQRCGGWYCGSNMHMLSI